MSLLVRHKDLFQVTFERWASGGGARGGGGRGPAVEGGRGSGWAGEGGREAVGLAVTEEAKQEGLVVVIEVCDCPLREGGRSVDHNGACPPRSRHLSASKRDGLCAAGEAC